MVEKLLAEPHFLSVRDAVALLASRQITSERLVRSCLERIDQRNADVRALVSLDGDQALEQARLRDREARVGVLHGIPFAAKDVLDTADFPTSYGSPIYARNQPAIDSASVTYFKCSGAVLVGKTATSEFATRTPAATCNPLRLSHTPGGSSSGSAAAVADCMIPFALATQTTGSITRPASYCGVVGFKPTFDLFSRAGMKMLSQSQDTIGIITRTIEDASIVTFQDESFALESAQQSTPRFGLFMSSQWEHADQALHNAVDDMRRSVSRAGHDMPTLHANAEMESLIAIQAKIVAYEAFAALRHEQLEHSDMLSDLLRERLAFGESIDIDDYLEMRSAAVVARQAVHTIFDHCDVLIYPATESSAEEGVAYSGSPRFGALWTLLHLPTVTIPFSHTANGMPFGLQLVGNFGCDRQLLIAAQILTRYFKNQTASVAAL